MSRLEEVLGRTLSEAARGSVPTLNDLSPELLAEAKALALQSLPMAVRYLQFHVVRADEAPDFSQEALLDGADPATWGTRDVLCVRDSESPALLSLRVSDVLDSLRDIDGERWLRMPPANPPSYQGILGAPGVLIRAVRYWWHRPAGVEAAVVSRRLEQIGTSDFPIAVRRWMATRFAWFARDYLTSQSPTLDGVVAALDGNVAEISADARAAISGLLRELQTLDGGQAPALGFRGPDEWYRSV